MSILNKLTEGIVNRDLSRDGDALLNKWEKTGLLEGLDDYQRNTMSVLLENQAKELLRESNSMAGGDVEGFAAVAFPIVRRVFGGLLAQKLVSVQPMSLPSGLIFFMDFVKQGPNTGVAGSNYSAGEERTDMTLGTDQPSVYGQQIQGREILTQGAELDPEKRGAGATPQFQDLIQGFSSARGATQVDAGSIDVVGVHDLSSQDDDMRLALGFDADLLARTSGVVLELSVPAAQFDATGSAPAANHPLGSNGANIGAGGGARMVRPDVRHVTLTDEVGQALVAADFNSEVGPGTRGATGTPVQVRRLSSIDADGNLKLFVLVATSDLKTDGTDDLNIAAHIEFAMADNIVAASSAANPNGANADTLGALVGSTAWEMEGSVDLPEISIKVDSVAVTSVTRKLKASWTPELAQDLNAYHNLDAEVELTGILSEQIALEIDQEILADLIAGAKASTLYWSRRPGLFVNRLTGKDATSLAAPPDFTGSVSEWYETLVETINDVSADIHRKTLRGGANFLVCGPEVANILEFTSGFRASVTHDDESGSVGAQQVGSISKKWDLYVDPYFPRNVVLVGRKGSSFLESGYVYAPYVPLQTTPTIFHADDFTPRKAVMTRYGKKLVRPDMYGLVVVRDLEG